MIRRVTFFLFVVVFLATQPATAQQEMIEAQTRCAVINNQLVLNVADTVAPVYLTTPWQTQPASLCDRSYPPRCNTRPIYRFELNCTGTSVPWIKIFAAVNRNNANIRYNGSSISIFAYGYWQELPAGFAPLTDNTRIVRVPPHAQQPPFVVTVSAPAAVAPPSMNTNHGTYNVTLHRVLTALAMLAVVALSFFAYAGHERYDRTNVAYGAAAGFFACIISWWAAPTFSGSDIVPLTIPFFLIYGALGYLIIGHAEAIILGWYFFFMRIPLKAEIDRTLAEGRLMTPDEMVQALRRTHGHMSKQRAQTLLKEAVEYEARAVRKGWR